MSTDDAYVDGTISPVSAKVAGHVVELFVQDNQAVKQGELLLRVDPRDFQAKREQAAPRSPPPEANLRAARSEVPLTREGTRAQIDQAPRRRAAGGGGRREVRRVGRRGIARPARRRVAPRPRRCAPTWPGAQEHASGRPARELERVEAS